jgi:hypothetical protein
MVPQWPRVVSATMLQFPSYLAAIAGVTAQIIAEAPDTTMVNIRWSIMGVLTGLLQGCDAGVICLGVQLNSAIFHLRVPPVLPMLVSTIEDGRSLWEQLSATNIDTNPETIVRAVPGVGRRRGKPRRA